MTLHLLSSIPPPPGNNFSLGPLTFNYYGLCIALGVLAAVEIARRRWEARGGDPDEITSIGTVGVPAGLLGARIYHVITDWKMYTDNPIDILKIWNGGLGIPGGLLLGIAAGAWQARRKGITGDRLWDITDAIIPGIPVAQAIGRVGNWFNQEIFGGPSDLPWALEVDPQFRPAGFAEFETFHPAFLYEALLNLALAAGLILVDRRKVLKRGQILPLWIAGYGVLRFIIESIRTDFASQILGIRVNHWISAIAVIVGVLWFLQMRSKDSNDTRPIESFEDLAADDAVKAEPDADATDSDADDSEADADADPDDDSGPTKPLFS